MWTAHRSESINAFFDGYVHSKTTLEQFADHYENVLRSKIEKESSADFASFNTINPCITAALLVFLLKHNSKEFTPMTFLSGSRMS